MALWAAGWSYLLLALFYLLIDVIGFRRWAFPFVVIGMNAITIYVAHAFVPFEKIAESLVGGLAAHLGLGGTAFDRVHDGVARVATAVSSVPAQDLLADLSRRH